MEDKADCYPKRHLFKEWVADAKKKLGATSNAQVALVLGYQPSTLAKMLGKSDKHKPSDAVLKLLGDFLGRDYRLLMDDPSGPVAGIAQEQWDEATEKKRVLASAMFSEMTCMTDEEAEQLYQLWKHAQGIGRARLEAEQKANEGK